jgi:hypothetical protein
MRSGWGAWASATPLVSAIVLVACGSSTSSVRAYCEYGAVSKAQLDGCITHVTPGEIDRLGTNAARYARGETGCRQDAGPFCR